MPSLTVLYLLDYTDLGGGETSFLAFARECLKQSGTGVSPVILTTGETPVPLKPVVILPAPGPVAERLTELGVETRIIPYPRFLRRGPLPWFSLSAVRRIDTAIGEIRPQIIHANNFFGMLYAGAAARRRRLPLVWTCHGWFDIDTRVKAWTARRYAARVLCVSEAVRQEAEKKMNGRPRTITDYLGIVPFGECGMRNAECGINLRDEVRAELGVGAGVPLVGVVGRFQPIKGHETLLDALPELRRRVPGVRVWLIGDAFDNPEEQAHKRRIEERVRNEGLADCVKFLGFRSDARRLMRALDVLAIPSARESFSMAAVEGLEAGVPVVGPDGWGPKEIIEVPATGQLFRPGDATNLAEKLALALLKEGAGAAFDPAAGPARVAAQFTVAAHLRRTLAIYRQLLG